MDAAAQSPVGRDLVPRPTRTPRWLLPVLLPLAAVVVAHLLLEPDDRAAAFGSLAVGALQGLALVAGLVVVVLVALAATRLRRGPAAGGRRGQGLSTWTAVAVVAYFVLLTSVAGRVAPLPIFAALERHWQGKVLDLLWIAILFGLLHRWARTETGLRWRIEPGSGRPATILVGGTFALFVSLTVLSVALGWIPAEQVGVEQLAYNATIPNLTEELIWRGAMLAVLAPALVPLFGGTRRVLGAQVGWGVVISSVVFGLGHTILVDLDGVWSVSVAGGLFAAVMGLLLGWIWCRTGSVWPAFLLHCAPEVGVDIGMILMG